MELPPGLLDLIEDYVSDALDATGTHKSSPRAAPHAKSAPSAAPPQGEPSFSAAEPDKTEPDGQNQFAEEESYAWQVRPVTDPADEALRGQVHAQLAIGDSVIPDFSVMRPPRGSTPPPFDLPVIPDEHEEARLGTDGIPVEIDDAALEAVSAEIPMEIELEDALDHVEVDDEPTDIVSKP